ncbi:sulfite exporter TauE/SafE family protein [Vibrio scophthalmi]|uniref:sulfite exporter TauE/SafE family protein n=1 Tax=Vibrio scophthalmi TaxID=45658 RepID=UPI002FF181EA
MMIDWFGAFVIGLVGAGHCMGMCGGIASMLTIGQTSPSRWTPVYYNLGRLISYALLGAIVGGAVASLSKLSQMNSVLIWLRLLAALFMILLACYIGKWWHGLLHIEKLGQQLWRFISPAGKSLLPLQSPLHALPFGMVWGWLPCGLVYSTLTWSAVSGSALNGALVMLMFGLGTLPAMLAVGMGAEALKRIQNSSVFRQIVAFMLLIYGIFTGYDAISILLISL